MTREELIEIIQDIEWDDFEAKEAMNELPKNTWDTVSSFSNTSGTDLQRTHSSAVAPEISVPRIWRLRLCTETRRSVRSQRKQLRD